MKIFSVLFLLTGLIACSQNRDSKRYTPHPKAKQLADSAGIILSTGGGDVERVVHLLEQATQIDSNFYNAFFNKLGFQISLKRYNDALLSGKNLIRIKPLSPDAYMYTGMISWKLGDTTSALDHFTKANELFDRILDTMSTSDNHYQFVLVNKAYNLILLGRQEKGNQILTEQYNKETNENHKMMYKLFIGKSRQDILNDLFNSDTAISESNPAIKD